MFYLKVRFMKTKSYLTSGNNEKNTARVIHFILILTFKIQREIFDIQPEVSYIINIEKPSSFYPKHCYYSNFLITKVAKIPNPLSPGTIGNN